MVNMNKLTEKAQEALLEAQKLAESHGHSQVEPEHLLLSLINQDGGIVPNLLQAAGADPGRIRQGVISKIEALPKVYGESKLYLSQRLSKALGDAEQEAGRMRDDYSSTEHLLLGILNDSKGLAAQVLSQAGVTKDKLMQALARSAAPIASLILIQKANTRRLKSMGAT